MNTGRTLFAQLMDFLPWSSFDRVVARYDGNRAVRKLSCAAQYQVMAFAQLTYRESLRDIEACLSAQTAKLYIWVFANRFAVPPSRMPMSRAIGASMPSSPNG